MRKEKYISYQKRGNSEYYQLSIKTTNSDGKRTSITRTFAFSEYGGQKSALIAACHERDQLLVSIQTKQYAEKNDFTFERVYGEMKELFPKRYQTFRKYDIYANKYLSNLLNLQIQEITAYDIMKCLNQMVSTCTDDSIGYVFTIVKQTFKTARIKRYITVNVTEEVIVPKSEYEAKSRAGTKSTTMETVNAIIGYLEQPHRKDTAFNFHMIAGGIWAMCYCGLRPAETFALDKSDIDLENGLMSINKELGSGYKEKHTVRPTKTKKSKRVIPIPEELADILKEYMEDDGCPILFHTYKNEHFLPATVNEVINRASKVTGKKMTMYQLRHKFATDLIHSGTDVRVIMDAMGHESPSMSIEYARTDKKLLKTAFDSRKFS